MVEKLGLGRADLRAVAVYQKVILVCILVHLALVAVQFALPLEMKPFLLVGFVPLSITATVFVFLLATKVYSTGHGILMGLLTLIPCVGLIALLVISNSATSVLKDHGIRVGLLGANMSDGS